MELRSSCIDNAGTHPPVTCSGHCSLCWSFFKAFVIRLKDHSNQLLLGKNILNWSFGGDLRVAISSSLCSAILTSSPQALHHAAVTWQVRWLMWTKWLHCTCSHCCVSGLFHSATKDPLFSSTLAQGKPYRSAALKLHWHKPSGTGQLGGKSHIWDISRQFWQSKQRRKWRVPTLLVFSREQDSTLVPRCTLKMH